MTIKPQPQPQPLESPADSSAAAAATTGKRDSTEDGPTEHGEKRQQKKQKAAEPTTSSVDEFGPDGMTALQRACGRITLAHTASEIYPFSVTSFHRVGTASGLYDEADVVPYAEGEAGDVQ